MKKRNLSFLLALVLLAALTGCGRDASANPELSGETAEPTDIAGHAAEASILEGLRRGLYDLPSDGLFRPDEPVSGGEFVAALWNLAGQPKPSVPADSQTRNALAWADENGFLDADAFDPDALISRQDAMRVLYAYNGGVSGVEAMLTGIYDDAFTDSAEVADADKPSLYWGFYNVLIREPERDKIAPFGTVSRGDMAAMLVRYMDDFQSE